MPTEPKRRGMNYLAIDDDTLLVLFIAFMTFVAGLVIGRYWRMRTPLLLDEKLPKNRCRSCGWQSGISNYEDGLCTFCRRAQEQHVA